MTDAELQALIELQVLPGVGPAKLRELLRKYGSFRAALEQAPGAELGEGAAAERGSRRSRERAARGLDTVRRYSIAVVREGDPNYPDRLHHLHQPPPVLYLAGDTELLGRPSVAVIGSRRNSEYGAEVARDLATALALAGWVVVSGMARGIDGIAHEAALEAGCGTIAVQGCGVDVVYPREHAALQRRIGRDGLLVTEFPPGDPPKRDHFPRRNRLIAALSAGVVVVEAGARSGALITVGQALDLGREVFAVPGPITRTTSAGTNALLREGATPVTGIEDVLEGLARTGLVLQAPSGKREVSRRREPSMDESRPELPADRARLWRALDREPRHAEELAAMTGLRVSEALSALVEMELVGLARQLPGKQFVKG